MAAKTKVTIYHNPRCSNSRKALERLRERGIEAEVVEYLKQAPAAETLLELMDKLVDPPELLLRKKETPYRELGLSDDSTRDEIADAIAAHPILLQRPVVVVGKKAIIARPPERIDALL